MVIDEVNKMETKLINIDSFLYVYILLSRINADHIRFFYALFLNLNTLFNEFHAFFFIKIMFF